MTKLLYLSPHLSTGGQPEYLRKKIELLQGEYDTYCIEWENTGGNAFVVQRNKIKDMLRDKFYCVDGSAEKLITLIKQIQPDIIHLEEIPEMWLNNDAAFWIYNQKDFSYKIFETSHDSSYDVSQKRFFPDKFLFVSQWQINQYKDLGIPCELVEYPIEYKQRDWTFNQDNKQQELGMERGKKHIIHVGLFTPRKNQAELFEIARAMVDYPVHFHFVGNQAGNFEWYWKPLMDNLPPNVTVWGERADVDNFYQAADLMVFTSRGNDKDKETMPLVIREAISWKLPTLIYNLPVYLNYFDKFDTVSYLKEDENNIPLICEKLDLQYKGEKETPAFAISFDGADNKIHFTHQKKIGKYLISIKDIDCRACIWSYRTEQLGPGHSLWIMPKPKHVIDFEHHPLFGGFLVQVFSGNNLVQEHRIRLKDVTMYKPEMDLSNDQPIWDNYNEFFVDRIYDRFLPHKMGIVLDIGANIGLFTKYLLHRGAWHVYAFEPNQEALVQLNKNYKDNKAVTVVDKAIAAQEGKLWFYTNPENSLVSALHSSIDKGERSYKVDAITLGDYVRGFLQPVDLVKIDVEGAEFEIIESLGESDYKMIKAFLIEYHDFYYPDGEQRVEKMIETLGSAGYKVERAPGAKFIYANLL